MQRLRYLKAALIGGASVFVLANPAAAKLFDIPQGDLEMALNTYTTQAGVQLIYSDQAVRGHRSPGAKGQLTEIAALTEVLKGSGFTTRMMPSDIISIVPEPHDAPMVKVAQASKPAASPPPPQQTGLETVVVTAQKKSEDIQTVPIAITALSQQQLTERQIAGGPDLVKEVPNLTFSKTNFSGYNLEIRGIGTQAISVTTDPAVAVAFNDIPFIRNHFFEQEFYDLDNVEVLRGPQGTLYGRNATAGVVNVISAKPTDSYEAMLSADVGNYDSRRYEAMLNIPIVGDTLDFRIAGEWTKRDGYSFNTVTNSPIDGRDLWSGRATLGWKPVSNVQTYLVWEHFSEDDDRLRSGKQLCKTAPIPSEVGGVPLSGAPGNIETGGGPFLSQGCEMTSLYSPQAFEVPNGFTLPYVTGPAIQGVLNGNIDPYAEVTQSTNLRDIQSALNPHYMVKNDTVEFNATWNVTPALTFTSQSGYNHDFLWSEEDYNRFTTAPGIFRYPDTFQYVNLMLPDPASSGGIFCDPQLGCSDRLVAQDLSEEHAWQLNQEFRLASNFDGPINFSVGANYLHYETEENYYVFINTLTALAASPAVDNGFPLGGLPWVPNVSDNHQCFTSSAEGYAYPNPTKNGNLLTCGYIDPNPIGSLNNEGHNYFLSQNPYVLNSYAGFGEAYYNIAPDLKLTAGARWTDDQKHFIDIPSELLVQGYGYPALGSVNQQWGRWTGRTVLDWTPNLDFTDQTLVYASYAHGYKAGGANPPGAVLGTSDIFGGCGAACVANETDANPIHPATFKPEYIEAFELGTKDTLLDGSLTLNGDIFYYNYTGYQISEIVDRTAINNNYNAHVEGAEVEANWEPLPGLKFNFAGGWEDTAAAGGDEGIDLMDRTAGNPNWIVVKPFVTQASNCILPVYVIAADLKTALVTDQPVLEDYCSLAYQEHVDPLTGNPYVANPTLAGYPNISYAGFDPVSPTATNNGAGPAPNNGEGFDKNLSGHALPNAPPFTVSLSGEYSLPVSENWVATLHGDFYWQDDSWARIFNDNPYDRLRGYSTVNLALTLTSSNGWQVMAYVKNLFDVTAITGDFLNSDDSGLTTNVFLTDPRLFGVRVTKQLDQGDGFWGSDYSGYDFFTGLFSDTDNGRPPLWIELGGAFEVLDDSRQPFDPPFMAKFPSNLPSPIAAQHPPHLGLDWEGKVSFEPEDTDWVFTAAVRYGRSVSDRHFHGTTKPAPVDISLYGFHDTATPDAHYVDGTTHVSQSHAIFDFMAGKDVGLGLFGAKDSSTISGGIRIAQFGESSSLSMHTDPDYTFILKGPKYNHDYTLTGESKRSFHGLGPSVSWSGSTPISDASDAGGISFDWGTNGAALFGRQTAQVRHQTTGVYLCRPVLKRGSCKNGVLGTGATGYHSLYHARYQHTAAPANRSRMVVVPNLGAFAGISWRYQNAKVSFGYRADEFFGAMDGGIDTRKSENVGFFGPYANISIGFGG